MILIRLELNVMFKNEKCKGLFIFGN